MTTHESGDHVALRLRVRLLAAAVRGAVSGSVHAVLTWLIDQLVDAV